MTPDESDPILVLCYGNPAREDDGLGPACAELLAERELPGVQVESNYQLMVEDSAAIAESRLVVFVDASVAGIGPYTFISVEERANDGYMSHSIGPERLLGLTREAFGRCPPAYLLAIRGYSYRMFTEGLTEAAHANLAEALDYLLALLQTGKTGITTHCSAGPEPVTAPQEATHER